MTNTFIQFPAERTSSLEQFLQPRFAVSCPASRMVSLEEETEYVESSPYNDMLIQWPATRGPSLDDEDDVSKFSEPCSEELSQALKMHIENTFSQWPATRGPSLEEDSSADRPVLETRDPMLDRPYVQWPATRGPSLEEFIEAKQQDPYVQWPATRGPSLEEFIDAKQQDPHRDMSREEEVVAWPAPCGPSLNEFMQAPGQESGFVQWAPMQSFSFADECTQGPTLNEFIQDIKSSSIFQEFVASDASTETPSRDEETAMQTPPSGLSDDDGEKDCYADHSATLKISLTDSLGLWSVGSAGHDFGNCKPCAFLWRDPQQPGCQNGRDCTFCHLCPAGEVKRRKKEKMTMRKMNRSYRYQNQMSNDFRAGYQNQVANGFEGHEFDSPGIDHGFGGQYQSVVGDQFAAQLW